MVKNPDILEQFELEYDRENPLTLQQKLDLFEAMYELARDFGHFDADRSDDDVEHVVVLAKILNEQIQPTAGEDSTGA